MGLLVIAIIGFVILGIVLINAFSDNGGVTDSTSLADHSELTEEETKKARESGSSSSCGSGGGVPFAPGSSNSEQPSALSTSAHEGAHSASWFSWGSSESGSSGADAGGSWGDSGGGDSSGGGGGDGGGGGGGE